MDPVAMELVGVRIELPTNVPILLLREDEGTRYVPIWIGPNEATAIALALQGVEPQRPMTHDLLSQVVTELEAEMVRVDVTELVDGTFFANLVLAQNGKEIAISARPSDAIALAARTRCRPPASSSRAPRPPEYRRPAAWRASGRTRCSPGATR